MKRDLSNNNMKNKMKQELLTVVGYPLSRDVVVALLGIRAKIIGMKTCLRIKLLNDDEEKLLNSLFID